nr:MFS transporter [Nonomuraea sp. FMUSA5-5]
MGVIPCTLIRLFRDRGFLVRYRDLFAVREFRLLYAGLASSYAGDQLAALAVSVLVLDRTGSGILSGLAYASAYLPSLVAAPLLGALADRLPRRGLLIACDLARSALVSAMLIHGLPVWALVVLLYAASLFTPPFMAARSALIAEILPVDAAVTGNGLIRVTHQLSQVLGLALGGLAIGWIGPEGALACNALTFAVSAALSAGLRPRPRPAGSGSVLGGSRAGVRYVFADPWLRGCLLLVWPVSMFVYAPEAVVYLYATSLGGGAPLAGLMLSSAALGFASGTVLLTRLVPPRTRDRLLIPFAILAGAALIPLWAKPSPPVVVVLLFASGVGGAFSAPLNALFVQRVSPEFRGRAMGVAVAGLAGGQGLGFLLAGALSSAGLHPAALWAGCGAAATLAALLAALTWARDTPPPSSSSSAGLGTPVRETADKR